MSDSRYHNPRLYPSCSSILEYNWPNFKIISEEVSMPHVLVRYKVKDYAKLEACVRRARCYSKDERFKGETSVSERR